MGLPAAAALGVRLAAVTVTAPAAARPVPSRSRRMAGPASGALLAGSATGFLYLVNPHSHQVFLPCPFRLITGLYCPFCGGLRMVHDLVHGHLVAALHDDALALPLLLIAAAAWLNVAVGRWGRRAGGPGGRGARPGWPWPRGVGVPGALALVRNLPFGPFTALHP